MQHDPTDTSLYNPASFHDVKSANSRVSVDDFDVDAQVGAVFDDGILESGVDPAGLKYRIRPLICGFVAVSTGYLVLVDESAEDRCAVDAVLGEVDRARWPGFSS
ncbi:hypothetical protein GCM10009646_78310 [Streptomyces aureus]